MCLLGASVVAAWIDPAQREPGFLSTIGILLAIASGPIFGWWTAYSRSALPNALPLLVLLTLLSAGPLTIWFFLRRRWLLRLATVFWLFAGYYFAIGMWI